MSDNTLTRARAPVRIDLAGGWTDVEPFCSRNRGYVVNASINRFAHVTIRTRTDSSYVLHSGDSQDQIKCDDIRQLEYNGNLDLLKAAVKLLLPQNSPHGMDLSIRSDAPPGSGVGSSSAASVAALAALNKELNNSTIPIRPQDIAEMAYELESKELGIHGGRQDQYAAAIGGINGISFDRDNISVSPLHLENEDILELEERFIICYTGISRLSGETVSRVMTAYENGNKQTTGALDSLVSIAREMSSALVEGDIDNIGRLMDANWREQKKLDASISTREIEEVVGIGTRVGIKGAKVLGAGGGGCVLLLSEPGREGQLRRSLSQSGYEIMHFSFFPEGVQTWTSS